MAHVWPTSPTCCRPSQISASRFSRRLDPSTRLAVCGLFVRKLARPPSRLSLASLSAWKTSCRHSKRIMHGRELRCDATEIVQEPGFSPDLLTVQGCTEQFAHPRSEDKHRTLLAYQPQYFELIFGIAEVPPFLPCCGVGRKSRISPLTSLERSPSAGGFVCSLSTSQDFLNLVLPVHS